MLLNYFLDNYTAIVALGLVVLAVVLGGGIGSAGDIVVRTNRELRK